MCLLFPFLLLAANFDCIRRGKTVILAHSMRPMLYANMKGKKNMITMQTVLDQLMGNGIVDALTEVMAEQFEDFAEAQKRYADAVTALREALGEDTVPSVREETDAIQRQAASDLFYSGLLGLKANLDHFRDPMARTFLDVDFDTYLQESTAHRLPEYARAQDLRDRFFALLTPEQRAIHEDITAYVCYLETAGPKLAHYYGYLLGNEILYRVVPGYHADMALTIQYGRMLEAYFGKRVDLDSPLVLAVL